MALIYYDKSVEDDDLHPAIKMDKRHPCYEMRREMINGKSVFYWNDKQAYEMYEWYCIGYRSTDIETEFGERVDNYEFKKIITSSHYAIRNQENQIWIPSDETIEELYQKMEKQKEESGHE